MPDNTDAISPSSSEASREGTPSSASAPAPQPTDSAPSSSRPSEPTSPSPGTREAEHQSLLAAVQDVVKVHDDPIVGEPRPEDAEIKPAADTPSPSKEPTSQESAASFQDPDDAELGSYKPDTRKRIETLLAQRNEARQLSERYRTDAETFAQFRNYQTTHQLENDDINLLMDVGAALRRGDFQGFLERVSPYIDAARQAVGLQLPPDLQEQVDLGQIPLDTAREIGIGRINQARLQTEANTYRQSAELGQQQSLAKDIYSAVADWETQTKARDPDWVHKQDIVEKFSQSLVMTKGRPASPQQAVAMAQEAYEEANRVVGRMRPQPTATRLQPSGVQNTTGNGAAAPEPRTLMEAAILGLQRGNVRMH